MATGIDYTSKDFLAIREDMLAHAAQIVPEWTARDIGDFGVMLVETFAAALDRLTFYGDRIANEAFIQTAVQRSSILLHAAMLDYRPSQPVAAKATVQFTISASATNVVVPKGTKVSTPSLSSITGEIRSPVIFETDEAITIPGGATLTETVGVTQGETVADEILGVSAGGYNETFPVFNKPVIEGSIQVFVDEGSGPAQWRHVDHIIDAAAYDTVFTTMVDEDDVTYVIFGDSTSGRPPANGATITATYRVGGGDEGNLPTNSITEMVTAVANVIAASNTTSATGGVDRESDDEIRENAVLGLRTLERAVTLDDYADLAKKVNGIAKAKASGTATAVTVRVAPTGGGSPTAAQQTDVGTYLEDKKMIGTTVTVGTPTYVPVDFTFAIVVDDRYPRQIVLDSATARARSVVAFGAVDFGLDRTIGEFYQALLNTPGVVSATITLLRRDAAAGVNDIIISDSEIAEEGVFTPAASGGIV